MKFFSIKRCAIILASFSLLSSSLTIPNDQRKVLGLPLLDTPSTDHSYKLSKLDHELTAGSRDEHPVTLEARRGRGGGPGRARSKPQRKKPINGKKPTKPKRNGKKAKKPQDHKTRNSRPTKTKPSHKKPSKPSSPYAKSKSTKNTWPTPSVARPTTAIDPCGRFIDCDKDDASSEISARAIEEFVVDLGITEAPVPTPAAPYTPNQKRDIRTQKPELGGLGVLTIKNLDYPSSGELLKKQEPKHHHAFQFENEDKLDDFDVEHTKAPKKHLKYATEHILELQSIGRFLNEVTHGQDATKQAFARWLLDNWNAKLTDPNVAKRKKPSPDYKLSGQLTYGNLIWNALGSNTNLEDFVLCETSINSYKARIWKLTAPTDPKEFQKDVKRSVEGAVPSNGYLTNLKMVFGVFQYMNNDIVTRNMRHAIRNVETEFSNAKNVVDNQPLQENLGDEWKKWIQKHLDEMSEKARAWVNANIKEADDKINAQVKVLKATLKTLQANEKRGAPAYKEKQKAEKDKLEKQMAKIKKELAAQQKDMLQLQVKVDAAQGAARKSLRAQQRKKEKALEKKVWAYGKAERKRALLYSGSVRKVIQGFEGDKEIMAGYKRLVNTYLQMPKAY